MEVEPSVANRLSMIKIIVTTLNEFIRRIKFNDDHILTAILMFLSTNKTNTIYLFTKLYYLPAS